MENGNPVMNNCGKISVLIMRLEREQKFSFKTQGFDIIDVFIRMIEENIF